MPLLPAAWTRTKAASKVLDFVTDDHPAAAPAAVEPAAGPAVDVVARRLLLLQR